VYRRRVPIHYKGQWYFEMSEYLPAKEMETLVDREGKLAAAKAAAEAAKTEEVNGRKKKGATTKNAKKGKKEVVEPSAPVARELPRLQGSRVEFFLNGEPLGSAFDEIYDFLPLPPLNPQQPKRHGVHHFDPQKDLLHDDGTLGYYPMVSCFGRGKLRCNFGPEWVKPPATLSARAMSERWSEFRDEERELDEADEEEAAERMRKEMEEDEKRKATMEARLAQAGAKKKSAASASAAKRKKGTATPTPGPEGLSRAGTPKSEARRTPRPEGTPVKLEVESARATPAPSTPGARGGSVSRAGSVSVSRAGSVSVSRAGSVASMRHEEARDESKMDVDDEEGVKWE
jgi:COMPASS component BRE2